MVRFCSTLIVAGLLAGSALAQAATDVSSPRERMKSCNADAKTQGLKGAERKSYMSTCLKGEPPVASLAPASPAGASPTIATAPAPTAAPGRRAPTAGQLAERDRIKRCGAEWQADKAAGKIPAGQTWPKFWSACNTRLKGG